MARSDRPPVQGTIHGCLASAAERDPGGPYLLDGERSSSFAEVAREAARASLRLARLGIGPGSRVVLWLPNGMPWMASFFGVLSLGGTVVPASTRLRPADLQHILADCGARALVYLPEFLGIDFDAMVSTLLRRRDVGELPNLEHVVAAGQSRLAEVRDLESLAVAERASEGPHDPDSAAIVCYTSGSTGRPKGCIHSHRPLVRNAEIAARLTGLAAGERIVCPVPFAHVFGFHMGVLQCAVSGAALINAEPYSAKRLLDLAERDEATVLYCVPAMAREVLVEQCRHPRRLKLRRALVAGAPVSTSVRRRIVAADGLAGELAVVYGCTEAPTISQLMPDDPEGPLWSSVGRPTPGVEVRVARSTALDRLPAGEVGEILVRGYNRMLGYVGDPEATERKYRDGWLVTGDLGRLDDDGYLYVIGRADETFLVGGFNVYPRDVEFQLGDLPGIADVAVIGVPDERLGQVPMAWITVDDVELDERRVLEWATRNLASYKRPRHVHIVDALPRVGAGKVARATIREESRRLLPDLPWGEPNRG